MAYGLSFVYGATGTTDLAAIAAGRRSRRAAARRWACSRRSPASRSRSPPFRSTCGCPTPTRRRSTPFVAWLTVAPEGRRLRGALPRLLRGRGRPGGRLDAGRGGARGADDASPATSWRCPSRTPSGCWRTPASRTSATCWSAWPRPRPPGTAMVLFYLVAYVFGNMGAFLVVEAVARAEGSEDDRGSRGLAQRSPLLALAMLLFLLSLGGIPFVAGFWAKLYVFWAAAEQRPLLAGAARRRADGGRALLLPARRQADVHRAPGRVRGRVRWRRTLALAARPLRALGVVALGRLSRSPSSWRLSGWPTPLF